jgi:hypothetical protein
MISRSSKWLAMTIEFTFGDVLAELQLMKSLAGPLLEPDDRWKLDTYRKALETIRENRQSADWSLPDEKPLRTLICDGDYEKGSRRGTYTGLQGEFSAVWTIAPVPMAKASQLPHKFVIVGKASTKLRLVQSDGEGRRHFLLWRMEISDLSSPGSFFHVQIGEDLSESPLFQPLPIPRLPCPPASPLLALEYMLAELFQDRWPERLHGERRLANEWRNLQRPRLDQFLMWQQQTLSHRAGSPVVDLKTEKPRQDLLTGKHGYRLR